MAEAVSPDGWRLWSELMEPVMRYTCEYRVADLVSSALDGTMQAWAILDRETQIVVGGMATRVVAYASGLKTCIIVAASTSGTRVTMESMRGVVEQVAEFARYQECDTLRIMGRPGWARVFRDFQTTYVCLERGLQEVN